MNWLLYISGWFIGWVFWNGLIKNGNGQGELITIIKLITWTMLWIWICWRFVS